MRHDDLNSDNLFSRLFSYTPSEGEKRKREPIEDYCTESLAWCLKNSKPFQKRFLRLGKPIMNLPEGDETLEIHTQQSWQLLDGKAKGKVRFDLLIHPCDISWVLVIESKIEAELRENQLSDYRKTIESNPEFRNAKPKIVATVMHTSQHPQGSDCHIKWSQVQSALAAEAREQKTVENAAVQFVCSQFSDFLKQKGLGFMIINTAPDQIGNYAEGILLRENLESILSGLAENGKLRPILQRRQVKFQVRGKNDNFMWLGIETMKTPYWIGFAIDYLDKMELLMYVEAKLKGEKNSLKAKLEQMLPATSKVKIDYENDGEIWINAVQKVDATFKDNSEAIREWLIKTSLAFLELDKSK